MIDIGECMRRRLDFYRHKARRYTLVPWALAEPNQIPEPDVDTRETSFGDAELALLYSGNMGAPNDPSLLLDLARRLGKENPKIIICFACRGNREKDIIEFREPTDHNIRFAPFAEEASLKSDSVQRIFI